MDTVQPPPLSQIWKERLDLTVRDAPELYEDPQAVGHSAHGSAIRTALAELGASAVFCVQDVPTVVIVVLDEYDRDRVIDLHGALWNQGLATLLLVLSGDTLRAFSLARIPSRDGTIFHDRCLVQALDTATDALAAKDLIYGAESGRLWARHADFFKVRERIDHVLLNNLGASYRALNDAGLSSDAAQALLIQAMFIAYLEDREIIQPEYFRDVSEGVAETFLDVLKSSSSRTLYQLFDRLRKDFNGDLFVEPCSFDPEERPPRVEHAHLRTLRRFLSGHEEMSETGSQLRFWGYDFKYIPIELISAVYDRFLGEREAQRRDRGAYYTPMFLADTVIAALWDRLPQQKRAHGRFLDPACGSGVFLVRAFQLLCEHWRQTRNSRTIPWMTLLAILSRLHGWDLSGRAVRVAVFSLYLALLKEVQPPDIRLLIDRGRLLPKLWGRTLCAQNFFDVPQDVFQADVIVGNPPWSSRHGADRPSITWTKRHHLPMPGKEDAWAFVWKSLRHIQKDGVVGFLLPAMGFLHNHSATAVEARGQLLHEARILRVVNFADMRFQLFEHAVRPAAFVLFGRGDTNKRGYRFDYWTPKADLNLRTRRLITLSSVDKQTVSVRDVREDPSVFKRRLWMSDPESKLFGYLEALPKLGSLVSQYRSLYRRRKAPAGRWVIGHGFKPAQHEKLDDEGYQYQYSNKVAKTAYLPTRQFRTLAQDCDRLRPFSNGTVHRRGFEWAFNGPRVLIPRGISTKGRRLRASYLEEPLTFEDSLLAVSVPGHDVERGKLLAALLNSKLLFWYAFHGTASFGSDRPEIKQAELLRLPFPAPIDVQQRSRSEAAGAALAALIDDARSMSTERFALRAGDDGRFKELDSLSYAYFGLGEQEIALVEDAVEEVIGSAQPHIGGSVESWRPAGQSDRRDYATMLVRSMAQWLDEDASVSVVLEARNEDLALLHLRLVERPLEEPYRERHDQAIGEALRRIAADVDIPLPGNFQLVPDFRLFMGDSLYLIKPLQRRFWLKSAAIADADAMAVELHDAVRLGDSV